MNRKLILAFICICLILAGSLIYAQDNQTVVVIELKGEVNEGMYSYLKKSVESNDIDSKLLLEIDTYGGRVDSAVKMSDYIISLPNETTAYVNKKAESAGVLLSISCDNLYMAQGSTIGSAETIPKTEKNISYWTKQLKTVAQTKGRDGEIVAAMADRDIEIEGLVEAGKLLNLTNSEALELGFIDGVAVKRSDIYEDMGLSNYKEIEMEKDHLDKMIDFISLTYVSGILLSIGFIGMIIEIMTPGFGVGGVISMIGFGLFFMGSILSGNSQIVVVFIFVVGLILLILEALAPGFGIFGFSGLAAIVVSIIMASPSISVAVIYISLAFILSIIALYLAIKYLPKKNKFSKTLMLNTNLNREEGFSSSHSNEKYMGMDGLALSYLRPSGKIKIGEEILDAISEGGFIEKESSIRVVRVEGSKIIVRKTQKEE